jgi:chemotaxis protein MotB
MHEHDYERDEGGHSWRPPHPTKTSWTAVLVTILALGAAGVGGYYAVTTRMRFNSTRAELDQQRSKRAELEQRVAALEKDVAEHSAGNSARAKQLSDAQADASATRAELDELRKQRAEMEQRLEAWKSITEKLKKMIDAGRLKVMIRDGRMILKLSTEVLFESGKADLAPDGKAALKEIAGVLRPMSERRFMIAGHTDNVPLKSAAFRDNWELSTARALTVTEFMIASGMRPDRLAAAGYGEFDPVASNKSEAGRHENRRIELVLVPNLAELPPLPADPPADPPAAAPSASSAPR